MDRGVQTPTSLSANSPRMLQLKRKLKSVDAALKRLRQRQNQNASEEQRAGNVVYPLKGRGVNWLHFAIQV